MVPELASPARSRRASGCLTRLSRVYRPAYVDHPLAGIRVKEGVLDARCRIWGRPWPSPAALPCSEASRTRRRQAGYFGENGRQLGRHDPLETAKQRT